MAAAPVRPASFAPAVSTNGRLRARFAWSPVEDAPLDKTMVRKLSIRTNRQIARQALGVANRVVFVGANAGLVNKLCQGEIADRLFAFRTAFEVSAYFKEHVMMPDELIVVRGSMSADHLERIVLSQFEPVVCWMDLCGKKRECPQCSNYTRPIYRPFRGSRRRSNRFNNDHCEGCSPSIDGPCSSRG